jgi:phospholipid/cholesterol/gamma-HCH transport system permease protein
MKHTPNMADKPVFLALFVKLSMFFFYHLGRYLLLLRRLFKKPENNMLYARELIRQMYSIGVGSIGIVTIIAVFSGAVTTVQTAYQLVAGWISKSVIGAIVSDSSLLELGPTITSLVLAGKIGLEIMGINAPGYLIGPKILGALLTIPLLIILSISLCTAGGMVVGELTGIVPYKLFVEGARSSFQTYNLFFSMTKAITFSFLISSISAYQGYYVEGGSLEVGKASTQAVVYSSVAILVADYVLAQLLL